MGLVVVMLSGAACSTKPTAPSIPPTSNVLNDIQVPRYLLIECQYEMVNWEDDRGLEKAYARNLLIGKGCNDKIKEFRGWIDGTFPPAQAVSK
ncbi:hypothetical protein D3C73_1356290 [compost metagenome]